MHLAVASLSGARAGNGLMVLVRVVYTRIGIVKDQLQSDERRNAVVGQFEIRVGQRVFPSCSKEGNTLA